jgi:hypothetical protein
MRAGFAELDRRIEGEIELMNFGLMPKLTPSGQCQPAETHFPFQN